MKKPTLLIITAILLAAASEYLVFKDDHTKGIQSKTHPNRNTSPKAKPQTITLDEDTKAYITLGADDEDNDTIGYRVVKQPKHGKLEGKAPNLTYIPNPDFNGKESFSFIANDGLDDSSETTIDLIINSVNDTPIAKDDKASLDEDSNVTIDVLANVNSNKSLYNIINIDGHNYLKITTKRSNNVIEILKKISWEV